MSRGHQVWVGTGHVGDTPAIKAPPSGGCVAEFRIAITETWRSRAGDREEHTEWVPIKAFGKTAESIERYVAKGRLVTVQGFLRTESWAGEGGQRRYRTWVYADEVHFHGTREHTETRPEHKGRAQTSNEPSHQSEQPPVIDANDIPF